MTVGRKLPVCATAFVTDNHSLFSQLLNEQGLIHIRALVPNLC